MTLMQEQAMDLIKKMPDEKIYYLINLLSDLVETTPIYKNEPTNAQKAYKNPCGIMYCVLIKLPNALNGRATHKPTSNTSHCANSFPQ